MINLRKIRSFLYFDQKKFIAVTNDSIKTG